jgi:hypothetical protein
MKITGSGRKQEDEDFGGRFLKIIDHVSSIGDVGGSVKSKEGVLSDVHKVFKDIYHLRHLAEDENLVSIFLLFFQNAIQFLQLRGISNETSKIDDLNIGE